MDCLKQNEELRGILDNLRMEQARGLPDSSKNGEHEIASLASMKVSNILMAYLFLFVVSSCHWFVGSYSYESKSSFLKWVLSWIVWFCLRNFRGIGVDWGLYVILYALSIHTLNFCTFFCLLGRANLWQNRAEQRRYLQKSCSFLLNLNKSNKHMMVLHACKTLSVFSLYQSPHIHSF